MKCMQHLNIQLVGKLKIQKSNSARVTGYFNYFLYLGRPFFGLNFFFCTKKENNKFQPIGQGRFCRHTYEK